MLSKGQEWDWLSDPFGRVQTLLAVFVLGLIVLAVREMRTAHPIIDFRCLAERNFAVCCIILFFAFAVVYGASIALPGMLQTLFGYDALRSGLVMSPSGASSLAAMVCVGFLLGRQMDARWLIAGGLVVMAAANYWMTQMNLEIGPWQVVHPRMVLTLGLGLLFAPASVAAYKYVPPHLRAAAVGLLSLLRTEGGSVGTSMASTIQERREQFHLSRLVENLGPLNPHVHDFLQKTQGFFQMWSGDVTRSRLLAVQGLDQQRLQQAALLAYFDVFWVGAVVSLALVALVLVMKRSVAEKGEHIGGE
jgi:DHA2 family multidrug resistance protein